MSRIAKIFVWIILGLVLIIGFLEYLRHQSLHPSTDDAYLNANVVHVAPQVSGQLVVVKAQNYQHVKKGDLLLQIDSKPFQIALASAQANLQIAQQKEQAAVAAVKSAQAAVLERQADVVLAQKNSERMLKLVKLGELSKQEGDEVTNKLSVAQAALQAAKNNLAQTQAQLGQLGSSNAGVKAAEAQIAQAQLNLNYATIIAPADGQLINFDARVGTMVQAGQALFDIVEDNDWWVDANFKETQLKRIRAGQQAKIITDMYPSHIFHGVVTDISPGSGSAFSLMPAENATGNWVKVTQRFPVKVTIQDASNQLPLRVGASATVTIDTTK